MGRQLHIIDIGVIILYLCAMLLVGLYFSRKNKNAAQFTSGLGNIPGWAIGMSIYATFLSSNTFLGVPGKTFGGDWNVYVFSLSMPLAAWVANKYFIPFYRNAGEISAYTHFEKRFGPWARTFTVVCFLLTQIARIGSIFFGIALILQPLTGFDMRAIMVVIGACIIIYTVMGGIEAVIWTEVVQAIVKTLGALLILYLIITSMPGGIRQIVHISTSQHKLSLGSFSLGFSQPTFWVILLYGFFINLNNFGVDQNYVQRYHAASSEPQARRSVWICVALYMPASLLFCIIGTCLFSYYSAHPGLLNDVRQQVAVERLGQNASLAQIHNLAATLKPSDFGDKVMPQFMVANVPAGITGLIVSAILAAAMSTISSGMNASATVFSVDIYKRYVKPGINDKHLLRLLRLATVVFGLGGMTAAIAIIGVKSVLDVWWQLSGIFAGGMLGLFLLALISRQTKNHEAIAAACIGSLVILWLTFPSLIPAQYNALRSTLNANMTIVVGTLTILLTGMLLTKLRAIFTGNSVSHKEI